MEHLIKILTRHWYQGLEDFVILTPGAPPTLFPSITPWATVSLVYEHPLWQVLAVADVQAVLASISDVSEA
jgi:hypothetical protein